MFRPKHTHTQRQVKTATPVVQIQMAALCNGAGLVCIIFIVPNVCDMNERTEHTVQLHYMFSFKISLSHIRMHIKNAPRNSFMC